MLPESGVSGHFIKHLFSFCFHWFLYSIQYKKLGIAIFMGPTLQSGKLSAEN